MESKQSDASFTPVAAAYLGWRQLRSRMYPSDQAQIRLELRLYRRPGSVLYVLSQFAEMHLTLQVSQALILRFPHLGLMALTCSQISPVGTVITRTITISRLLGSEFFLQIARSLPRRISPAFSLSYLELPRKRSVTSQHTTRTVPRALRPP